MGSFLDYLEIMRPINSIMVGVSIIIGAIITGGINILDSPLLLVFSFLTGFSLTGASMAINDYYDREIDKINEPNRPIPSGRIFPKNVLILIFTAILSVIGLISSWMISRAALSLAGIAWVIMMVYSVWGKRTGFLGNLMVSTCISLPFIYGGILSGETMSSFSFSLLAFLSNTHWSRDN
jgi:geranylgeranylglycerol-phosphate geranylgeranyltransferase